MYGRILFQKEIASNQKCYKTHCYSLIYLTPPFDPRCWRQSLMRGVWVIGWIPHEWLMQSLQWWVSTCSTLVPIRAAYFKESGTSPLYLLCFFLHLLSLYKLVPLPPWVGTAWSSHQKQMRCHASWITCRTMSQTNLFSLITQSLLFLYSNTNELRHWQISRIKKKIRKESNIMFLVIKHLIAVLWCLFPFIFAFILFVSLYNNFVIFSREENIIQSLLCLIKMWSLLVSKSYFSLQPFIGNAVSVNSLAVFAWGQNF